MVLHGIHEGLGVPLTPLGVGETLPIFVVFKIGRFYKNLGGNEGVAQHGRAQTAFMP